MNWRNWIRASAIYYWNTHNQLKIGLELLPSFVLSENAYIDMHVDTAGTNIDYKFCLCFCSQPFMLLYALSALYTHVRDYDNFWRISIFINHNDFRILWINSNR